MTHLSGAQPVRLQLDVEVQLGLGVFLLIAIVLEYDELSHRVECVGPSKMKKVCTHHVGKSVRSLKGGEKRVYSGYPVRSSWYRGKRMNTKIYNRASYRTSGTGG